MAENPPYEIDSVLFCSWWQLHCAEAMIEADSLLRAGTLLKSFVNDHLVRQ
jgi:hypothetical protein